MGELDGKVAVITGAGSGMARAATEVFVREGAKVLAADVSGAEEETAAALGDAVVACRCDVTDEASVEAMFAAAMDAFGRVDAVLNVAGIGGAQPLADITLDEYDRVMAVDLKGVMLGTKHGVRTMIPTGGGAIVNWSSIGGMNGSTLPTSVYSAAKAGVIAFTKQAAIEYGAKGIRANAICPGFIETPMSGGKGAGERFPNLVAGSPLARAGQPEEVGELGVVPRQRPLVVHHRRRHPDRRRLHREAALTTVDRTDVRYDPYDVEINADPYPTFRRLRDEAPIYRNDEYDFWTLVAPRRRRAWASSTGRRSRRAAATSSSSSSRGWSCRRGS